jgi:hypothetical protein
MPSRATFRKIPPPGPGLRLHPAPARQIRRQSRLEGMAGAPARVLLFAQASIF